MARAVALLKPTIFQWLISVLVLLFPSCLQCAVLHKTPRQSPLGPNFLGLPSQKAAMSSSSSSDFQKKYYEQTLDHFNYQSRSYATFKQKYVINSKYWGGPNSRAPIFVYLGAEAALDDETLAFVGTLTDNAPRFKALLVYIEHRFYGESIPFGLKEQDMLKNESVRGYFNSEQALADYAEILLHVKDALCAPKSPIIVVGGSYGGMLAAWFRLKYPHIVLGALASSAPILYFDDIVPQDAYFSAVQKDFMEESETCFGTIKKSWDLIDQIASKPNGLSILSQKFKICSELRSADELSVYIGHYYSASAQYNAPPGYPVKIMCDAIDGASTSNGSDVLGQIFAGMIAFQAYSGHNDQPCLDLGYLASAYDGWDWQACSEMVIPIGGNENISIVRASPFNLEQTIEECKKYYGVPPRPHWITTYYGGHDVKLILRKFGSNIIFSNGLQDPYSRGGVLENLSDSLLAIYTKKGSHCLDMHTANETDPKWLVKQRRKEVQILEKWITKYYADLRILNV